MKNVLKPECDEADDKAEYDEAEYDEEDDESYTPSAEAGDNSPSCPWKAPGMHISDFI